MWVRRRTWDCLRTGTSCHCPSGLHGTPLTRSRQGQLESQKGESPAGWSHPGGFPGVRGPGVTRGTVGGGTAPKGSETKKPGMAGWGARRPRSQKALPVRQSLAWVREVVKDSFGLWRRKARLNTNWKIQGFQGAAMAHPGPRGRWVQGGQEPTPLAGWAANPGCEQCLRLGRGLFVLPDSPDCPSGNWPPALPNRLSESRGHPSAWPPLPQGGQDHHWVAQATSHRREHTSSLCSLQLASVHPEPRVLSTTPSKRQKAAAEQ